MRHTIDEAASLVGRARRSIYRAMTEGRLSYGVEADNRRYIDTAELLRVYGEFRAPSHDGTPEMAHAVTLPTELADVIAQAVSKAVAEAVEPLRLEIEKLRLANAEQRLIEHKPEHQGVVSAPADPAPAPLPASKPESFADLLSGFEGDA